jgi:hypothetical protein
MLQPKLANLREKYKLKYITMKVDNANTKVNMRHVPRKEFLISQSVPVNDWMIATMVANPTKMIWKVKSM